jgi:hypothetical protein
MHLAHETLSASLRRLFDGMVAVHSAGRFYGPRSNYTAAGDCSMRIRFKNSAEAEVEHRIVPTLYGPFLAT